MRGGNVKSSLVAMVIAATGQVATRAGVLQVRGELTIRNSTNERSPSSPLYNLEGGYKFVLTMLDPELGPPESALGKVRLPSSFWPEPGEMFSAPFRINMRSPGPGSVEEQPVRVDGVNVVFHISAAIDSRVDRPGYQPRIGAAVSLDRLGVAVTDAIRGGLPVRDPPAPVVGEVNIRVDTIVPIAPTDRGDFDQDGDVDVADYMGFVVCFTGVNNAVVLGCHDADLDVDGDVDLADLIAFQAAFAGPQ